MSALYEQGRAHHVGKLPQLEEQMLGFTPDMKKSPDRVYALVWGATLLCVKDVSCQLFFPDERGRMQPAW